MSSNDWQEIIGAIGLFVLVTAVITVSIWQLASTRRAKVVLVRESEYRAIAEKAVAVQDNTMRELATTNERLREIQTRLNSLETLLKVVE